MPYRVITCAECGVQARVFRSPSQEPAKFCSRRCSAKAHTHDMRARGGPVTQALQQSEPAYEIVCRVDDVGRDEWLRLRKQSIGASEAAVLIGLSPWKSPLSLYAEKVGAVEPDDLSDNEAVFWGTRLEDVIRDVFAERTKRFVDRGGIMLRSKRYPWATCTLDGWCAERELGPYWPLELKTTGAARAEDWADGAPLHYRAQVAWQMMICDAPRATIACLIGGQRLVWEDIERDEVFERKLVFAAEEFWRRVEQQQPPPPDGSFAARAALHAIYPEDDGEIVTLPAELEEAVYELERAKADEKVIGIRKVTAENAIKAALGPATQGVLPDGTVVSWRTQTRKAYQVAETTTRVLRVKTPKQAK